jgi:acetolactate synthase I/II/III large subunit
MMIKLSDYVLQFLAEREVKHVFLLTGGMAMHLNDSLGNRSDIEYICNLHEQASAIGAEAYAKYDNRLGVVMVTGGPGATNTITGVAGAWLDSTPMLFLSGQVKRADLKGDSGLRNRGVQEVDIVEMVSSITKYAVTVTDPNTIRYHLEKAIYLAQSGRPGPTWLDIPLDVQATQIDTDLLAAFDEQSDAESIASSALQAAVGQAIELLKQAQRPFILLGNGIRLSSAMPQMRQLIETLNIPFGLTWPAMDFFPDDYPNLVGRPGPMAPRGANFALQNCDFLLTIGARLDVVCTAFAPEKLARAAKKVMVDIDPAELNKLDRFLDVPICTDAGSFLNEFLPQLAPVSLPDCAEWKVRCKDWTREYPLITPEHRKNDGLVSMYYFTEALCDRLDDDALVIPTSSGSAIEVFLLAFKAKTNQRLFNTTGLGPMGFGLPASIGGCLSHDRQTTICIDGDGGFQMNIQELETIVRLNLPIKIFVMNNGGYGSIIASQGVYFNQFVGCTPESGLTLPNTQKIAAAYGISSSVIANQSELLAGIETALNSDGPHICEVMVIPDEPRQPRVSSYQKPDGTMVSKPLEDLFPFLPRSEFLDNMLIPLLPE